KDIEKDQCVIVRRDTREKYFVPLAELETKAAEIMDILAKNIYDKALANREARTESCTDWQSIVKASAERTGYIKTMWCKDEACEKKMKDEAGLSSRCMPFDQEHLSDVCPICGKKAETMVIWGKAY
ncbi:MAG: proline--tRNA ligase, partial [Oscillospiraceae bacterium]